MAKAEDGVAATAGPFTHYTASPSAIYAQADAISRPTGGLTTLKGDVLANHTTALASVTGDLAGPMSTATTPVDANTSKVMRVALVGSGCLRLWGNAVTNFNRDVDTLNNEYAAAAADNFGVTKPVPPDSAARHSVQDSFDEDVADAKAAKLAELKRRYVGLENLLDTAAAQVASMLEKGPDDEATVVALYGAGALPAATAVQAFPVLDGIQRRVERWVAPDGTPMWREWWQRGPHRDWDKVEGPKFTWSSEGGPGLSLGNLKGHAYLWQGGFTQSDGSQGQWWTGTDGNLGGNLTFREGLNAHGDFRIGAGTSASDPFFLGDTPARSTTEHFVGGELTGDAYLGQGAKLSGGWFAGERVGETVSVGEDGDAFTASVKGEVWAGPGAKGDFGVWADDAGKIHLKAHGGASPLVGGKLGADVTIDPAKVLPDWLGGEPEEPDTPPPPSPPMPPPTGPGGPYDQR